MAQFPSRIKSFEGLKGFAVAMVIFYHLFPNYVPGGFLMVNTFLVLGGYFFAYKMEKHQPVDQKTNYPAIGRYLLKTFERLFLPLLWMMMIIVLGFVLFKPIELHYIRNDMLSALAFVSNWYQIFSDQSYFVQMTNATPFTHLWYNAIYLQSFILAIPLFLLTKRFKFSLPAKGIFWAIIVILSHSLMLFLYKPGDDPTRVYYGLDTRFSSFALGMATAYSLPTILNYLQNLKHRKSFYSIFAVLVTGLTLFFVLTTKDNSAWTYELVMTYFNLISMFLLWLITINPPITRFFWGNPIFDVIGKRSYSYYLWYYPVIVIMMGQFRRFNGNMLMINSLSILGIIFFGEVTYRLAERPIWQIPFANQWDWHKNLALLKDRTQPKKWFARCVFSGLFCLALIGFGFAVFNSRNDKRVALFELEYQTYRFAPNMLKEAYPAEKPLIKVKDQIKDLDQHFATRVSRQTDQEDTVKSLKDHYIKNRENEHLVNYLVNVKQDQIQAFLDRLNENQGLFDELEAFHPTVVKNLSKEELLFATEVPMTLFGDSIVSINGINTLEIFLNGNYYGQGSLQIWDAIPIYKQMLADGEVQENVVINLGTNASLDRPALDEMIELSGDRQVFFINTNSRVQHIDEVNRLIKEVAEDYPNVHEIDWHSYQAGHPDWYGEDEIHHSPLGMEHFTIIIAKTLYKVLQESH
ncbi:acyltransferase family protein [Ignavigranum ruoffiae]|uniref:acyltransferase family protein n=1 Tax=Ignavigranum ruoffiae TaxID=89093 RepID=UPI0024ACCAEB|nr:acyltransferase family protein [Ignavigranum ruoffiae]